MKIEVLEQGQLDQFKVDLTEKLDSLHQNFLTKVKPEQGIYGITEVLKDDGTLVKTGKNELGHTFRDYFKDGKHLKRREILGKGRNLTTEYDSNGQAYAQILRHYQSTGVSDIQVKLNPNAVIVKNNFTVRTDAFGRPISNKVTNLEFNHAPRKDISGFKNGSYRMNDDGGHLIAHQFGGPDSVENIVAQLDEVNRKKMTRVENFVKNLKKQGHSVDYEMRSNYTGTKSRRPTSFEPVITIDGNKHVELPKDLQKIYNEPEAKLTTLNKAAITVGEKVGTAHELGIKSGLAAAGLTVVLSSAENISAFVNGEVSGEEMAENILKETAAAGALGYGTTFITTAVSQAMSKASVSLINRVTSQFAPAAVVSFAVESYHSVSDFAQGKMDGSELAYDLGDNAVSVVGGIAGGALAGAAAGTLIAGPVAGAVGYLAGSAIGCVLASEMYATAVELGTEGAEAVAEQAQYIAHEASTYVRENIPEKFDEVKTAFTEFFEKTKLPFKAE